MTIFETFKHMTIDELADWLDKYGQFDGSPWIQWWDKKYCDKCEGIKVDNETYYGVLEYTWCELHNSKCKFFPDRKEMPSNKDIIKMWLEELQEECERG